MEAERYAGLLDPAVREACLVEVEDRPDELELQAHWFAGDFGREFRTTDRRSVRIVQFGYWNREPGPDFAEAAVAFDDGEPVSGAIELDFDSRDWERHGHDANPAYDKVVLHVCFASGRSVHFTRTTSHKLVPQIRLDLQTFATTRIGIPAAKPGRCSGPLRELPDAKAREIILCAARYRLQRKAAAFARLIEIHGPDEALFQGIAAALGYKSNKLPFNLLAQRLPVRLLLKTREEIDALIFGVSGFLNGIELTDCDLPTRAYLRNLWEGWWSRRSEFERITLAPGLWKLGGQRPVNHPQRRLAALCQCVHHWPKLRQLRESSEPKAIREFFGQLTDEYWNHHYTLTSGAAAKPMALVGESRVIELLANVFIPLAIHHRPGLIETYLSLRAPLSNRRAETAATRLLGMESGRREWLNSVAVQQGLLQVYDDFCLQDASDCSRCRFPEQLARW